MARGSGRGGSGPGGGRSGGKPRKDRARSRGQRPAQPGPAGAAKGRPGPRFVATIERRGRFNVATPVFERGDQVGLETRGRFAEGEMVWAELAGGRARVLRKLGRIGNARAVCEALALQRLGRRGFGKRLETAAEEAIRNPADPPGGRTDLRDLATFTVDPATARDFDDAVSARRDGDGIRLWIHIADVAAFVRPGSPLDREAAERANSTYIPTSVEPMLPPALSAGACSLSPGDERLAVTTEILLAADGTVRSAGFFRSTVRSDARLDYGRLDRIFAGESSAPEPVAEPLALARQAAAELARRRSGSALEVSSNEPVFDFDREGNVTAARAESQTEAHRLIEQLMVLNNEQVAEHLQARRTPTLYRVHEQPDPDRIRHLFDQLASLGIPLPPLPDGLGPTAAGQLAIAASRAVNREAGIRGHGAAAWSSLVLRSLKPAVYSERNIGHAGLGSGAYCHFTSPIRRYPDLLAHRGLLAGIGDSETPPDAGGVGAAALHCSDREREATRLERDADDLCAAFLLERELFEAGWERGFEGEVSGAIGAGVFITFAGELGEVYEGFLPARRLRGERFELNEQQTALIGSRSGRAVRIGDPVTVEVERVDAVRGRVDLRPADG